MAIEAETAQVEHFCTLFDSNFLPIGLNLYSSLLENAQPFHLWILCIDQLVEEQLGTLSLTHVTLIPVSSIETRELLEVKAQRSRGEYCWTLTPFLFHAVFERSSNVRRVTYLDADLFFFRDPKILLDEFEESGRDVLITEHAYAPKYDQTHVAGKFCVQFLTFKRNKSAESVLKWWQSKCLDWCFARYEDGKFGDQKYLDSWPDLFPSAIWVLKQKENTMAPWNVGYFYKYLEPSHKPVFFHFHGLRIIGKNRLLAYISYRIGKKGLELYEIYGRKLRENLDVMRRRGFDIPIFSFDRKKQKISLFNFAKLHLLRSIEFKVLK